jgi:CMP-N,N'-diacetyllegionaminic acid synthase
MTRVCAVIPARAGSRRLPGKNLALLGGRTLARRALETATAASRVDAVVLSSESDEILAQAEGLDVLAHRRPAQLAADRALAYDVAVDALRAAERHLGPFDVLALVQCTTPFALPEDIDGALELLERANGESVVTVGPAPDLVHPLKLKRLEGDRLIPFLEDDALRPSHELPSLWVRNGALYASRKAVLDRTTLVVAEPLGYPMPPERSIDVNTPLDLAFAEFLEARPDLRETRHA